MQRKEYGWIIVLLVVAFVYVHFFTHWFEKGHLVITPSRRPAFGQAVESIIFTLNAPAKIKNLKVVESADDGKFDPHGHLMWHLVSDSASQPTQLFVYGHHIHGMKQAPDNGHAEPLQPDVVYWIVVTTDHLTGSVDFKTRAQPAG